VEVQVGTWRYRWTRGGTGGHVEVQVVTWRYRWTRGGTGGHVEVQVDTWKLVTGGTQAAVAVVEVVGVLETTTMFVYSR